MYFRPRHYNEERQTCARARTFGSEFILKLCGKKLKKVDKVKFLGVIIDDKLNWEAQIDHIEVKLNSSIHPTRRSGIILYARSQSFVVTVFDWP